MKPTITDEVKNSEAARRQEICRSCYSYVRMTAMCKECFCLVPAKTRLKAEFGGKCPLGKW